VSFLLIFADFVVVVIAEFWGWLRSLGRRGGKHSSKPR
jgi:hypothetical protein